jgi:ribosomal protein S18 acetylase RimI-like enzyme
VETSTIRIRRARATDAGALAALRYEFRASYGAVTESRAAFVRRCAKWMRRELQGGSPRWYCWVAIASGGAIVGHVWLQTIDKIPNPVDEAERHAYISNLYVNPAFRGGTGGLLIDAALAWCRTHAIDSVVLWPTPRSRALYKRKGFRASGAIFDRRVSGP